MEREIVAEYELNEIIDDTLLGSVGSRLSLFARDLRWRSSSWHSSSALRLPTNCYGGSFVIDPNGRWYRGWSNMMFLWSVYSVFYTPLAFCFFRGLPDHLLDLECAQLVFLADVALHFFLAYRDPHTHRLNPGAGWSWSCRCSRLVAIRCISPLDIVHVG
uniref:Uncharacterized protein n=1 Tax=Avena sativa TaxID=4498 RepID=A0ACD5UVM8_AVESA